MGFGKAVWRNSPVYYWESNACAIERKANLSHLSPHRSFRHRLQPAREGPVAFLEARSAMPDAWRNFRSEQREARSAMPDAWRNPPWGTSSGFWPDPRTWVAPAGFWLLASGFSPP